MCIRNRNPPYTDVRRHGRNELSKRKWQNHDEKVPSLVMSFFSSPDERQKWSQKYRSCQQLYHRHCHRVREIWKHHFSDDVVTSTTQIPHHTNEGDLHKVYVCRPIHLEAQRNRKQIEERKVVLTSKESQTESRLQPVLHPFYSPVQQTMFDLLPLKTDVVGRFSTRCPPGVHFRLSEGNVYLTHTQNMMSKNSAKLAGKKKSLKK